MSQSTPLRALPFTRRALSVCAAAVLALFTVVAPLPAQEQERSLMNKLLKPDMDKEFVPRGSGGKFLKEYNAPTAHVKSFVFRETYLAKEFKTEAFRSKGYSTREFSKGGKEYGTANALDGWRKSADPNGMVKPARGIKSFSVENAPESGKSKVGTDRTINTDGVGMRGTRQKEMDKENDGRPAMDINQVRDLLNKNE